MVILAEAKRKKIYKKPRIYIAKRRKVMYTVVWIYIFDHYARNPKRRKIMKETMSFETQVREVDIIRILRMLWKRAWVIVLAAALFFAATYAYNSLFVTPTYRAKFTAYINNKQITEETLNTSTSDLSASKGLMYVYKEIVVSRTVLIEAAMKCELQNQGYNLVSTMVKAEVSENAPILTVFVETTDPDLSKRLADAVAEVAPEQVSKVVAGSTMTLIDEPYTPVSPYAPRTLNNAIYGAIFGVFLSVLLLILWDIIYDRVMEEDDLESRYKVPVVGRIPDVILAQKNDSKYAQSKEGSGPR